MICLSCDAEHDRDGAQSCIRHLTLGKEAAGTAKDRGTYFLRTTTALGMARRRIFCMYVVRVDLTLVIKPSYEIEQTDLAEF